MFYENLKLRHKDVLLSVPFLMISNILLMFWLSLHTKPVIQTIGQDDSKISFPSAVSSSEFSIV